MIALGTGGLVMVWVNQKYWQERGVPLAWFGVLWASYNLTAGFASKSAAHARARYGRRAVLIAAGVLPVVAYLGMASFLGWAGILFGILIKVGQGLGGVLFLEALNERISSTFRATVLSMTQVGVRASFFLLGPPGGPRDRRLGTPARPVGARPPTEEAGMTLARGTDRLESARLVLRPVTPGDLPFFTRLHGLPEVAEHLYPGGRPRTLEETAAWLRYTRASYERLALGYLAVQRKDDGALIGRCGLMDLVVESAPQDGGIRRGWFGREQAPAGVALTFETELGYTFDPAVWGQGFATEAARCVRDYARDALRLPYTISAILPQNTRSRRVAERSGARAAGRMEVVGLTWERYMYPLAPHERTPT